MKKSASVLYFVLAALLASFSSPAYSAVNILGNYATSGGASAACGADAYVVAGIYGCGGVGAYCPSGYGSGYSDINGYGNLEVSAWCVSDPGCTDPEVLDPELGVCAAPFSCDSQDGVTITFNMPPPMPSTIQQNGCSYGLGGVSVCTSVMCSGDYTGDGSTATDEVDGTDAVPDAPMNCITGSDLFCYESTGDNIGFVNGSPVDLNNIESNTIEFTESGDLLTGNTAPSPTDSGGTVVQPTGTITTSNGDTINYYQTTGPASNSFAEGVIAGNTHTMTGLLTQLAEGQCGGPGQPPCTMDDESEAVFSSPGKTGSFDLTGFPAERAALFAQLNTVYDDFKTQASSFFEFNHSATGSLPCPDAVDVEGFGAFQICLTPYESQLSIVGTVLILLSSFMAFVIIFR